jgi:hypothetical protein
MKPDFGLVQRSGKLPADEPLEGHCDRQQKTRQAKKRAGSERGFEAVKWCREPESFPLISCGFPVSWRKNGVTT